MTDANDSIQPDEAVVAEPATAEESPEAEAETGPESPEAAPPADVDAEGEGEAEVAGSAPRRRKTRIGVVISDVQDKTVVVRVDRLTAHRKYRKVIRRSKRYYVHDESNVARVGDRVQISETRPRSKLKRWRLLEVLQRGTSA